MSRRLFPQCVPLRAINVDGLRRASSLTVRVVGGDHKTTLGVCADLMRLLEAKRVFIDSPYQDVLDFFSRPNVDADFVYRFNATAGYVPFDCVLIHNCGCGYDTTILGNARAKCVINLDHPGRQWSRLPNDADLYIVTPPCAPFALNDLSMETWRPWIAPRMWFDQCIVWHAPSRDISRAHRSKLSPKLQQTVNFGGGNEIRVPANWSRLDMQAQLARAAWTSRIRVVLAQARVLYSANVFVSFTLHPETVGCMVWNQ